MTLCVPKKMKNALIQFLEEAYPEEGCGFMIGTADSEQRVVRQLIPAANDRTEGRQRRYLISPEDFIRAEKNALSEGLDVIGIYHSHPDHPAKPSEFDREHAWPWYSYVIAGIQEGAFQEMTSWVLTDDRKSFQQEKIKEMES